MNRIRLLAIAPMLILALAADAQQTTTPSRVSGAVPAVDAHLKVLAEKLDLTSDQQARVKPMLQEMHDASEKLVQDPNLSPEERQASLKPVRMKADKEIRTVLSDDQKKKLDQLEQESHMDLHGNPDGTTSPPSPQR